MSFASSCSFAVLAAFAFAAPVAPAQATAAETHGIAVANMDPSVKPGDNFYLYANGGWIARTEIPADRAGIGVFSTLADRSSKNVAAIIEEEAKSSAPSGSNARKIADLYNAYMDEPGIEARGLQPLQPHLASPLLSAKPSAPTSICSTTRSSPRRISSVSGSLPASATPAITFRICCRAAW
jgi:hypothetical protein